MQTCSGSRWWTRSAGDTRADICMIRRAGFGVAFIPKDDDVKNASENVITMPDMMHVIRLLDAAPRHRPYAPCK